MTWQHFTEAARKVVFYAQQHAHGARSTDVTPQCLLLALLEATDSTAGRALRMLNAPIEPIKSGITIEPSASFIPNQYALTAEAKAVIDHAFEAAKQLNNNFIGTEHLLLGFLADDTTAVCRLLNSAGVTTEEVLRCVLVLHRETVGRGEPSSERAPRSKPLISVWEIFSVCFMHPDNKFTPALQAAGVDVEAMMQRGNSYSGEEDVSKMEEIFREAKRLSGSESYSSVALAVAILRLFPNFAAAMRPSLTEEMLLRAL